MATSELDRAHLAARLRQLVADTPEGERRIVAIAGAPASGKSTLACELEQRLNEVEPGGSALVPMDGIHYDDEVLVARG